MEPVLDVINPGGLGGVADDNAGPGRSRSFGT